MFKAFQLVLFILIAILAQFESTHKGLFAGLALIGIVKVLVEIWLDRRAAKK